jgi:hypothetical protein
MVLPRHPRPLVILNGLAGNDVQLALQRLLGEEAPLSAGTVAGLQEQWQTELLPEVFQGAVYVNGVRASDQPARLAA